MEYGAVGRLSYFHPGLRRYLAEIALQTPSIFAYAPELAQDALAGPNQMKGNCRLLVNHLEYSFDQGQRRNS